MIRIRRILFPIDFSACSAQAMKHAAFLAEAYQAELHVLHVVVVHEFDTRIISTRQVDLERIHDLLADHAAARLDEAIGTLPGKPGRVMAARELGTSAADSILSYAHKKEIDLIVIGTHGRRGVRRFLLGSIAEKVVQLSLCPVLTVREPADPPPPDQMNRILVPVDFSKHAESALHHATEIAAAHDATLQLLHVVENAALPPFYAPGAAAIAASRGDIEHRALEELARLNERNAHPEVDSRLHVVTGSPSLAISQFAEESQTDLIVMATHGLSGIWQFVMGSVAEAVVRSARCPVLTVKAFGKSLVG